MVNILIRAIELWRREQGRPELSEDAMVELDVLEDDEA